MSSTAPARAPQEERTRVIRARLPGATLDCLVGRGVTGASTTLVSHRAGVSRGAQLHHLPAEDALVVTAVEHLPDVRHRAAATSPRPSSGSGGRRTGLDLADASTDGARHRSRVLHEGALVLDVALKAGGV